MVSVPPISEPLVFIQAGALHGVPITRSAGLIASASFSTGTISASSWARLNRLRVGSVWPAGRSS